MRSRLMCAVLGAALASIAAQQRPGILGGLPPELAGYRTWVGLLKEPLPVPMELWLRCARVTPADWAEAAKQHGPHTERYIRVYGNQQAAQGLDQGKRGPLPSGAIIAKEKLPMSPDASPDGIGFMIRHAAPAYAPTDGWEFLYFPSSGDRRQTHEACAACHRRAPSGSYVFGTYPRAVVQPQNK